MHPLIKGLFMTVALLIGGLLVTQIAATALEKRAEQPVDQAYKPKTP